jgi:hypothetical protein
MQGSVSRTRRRRERLLSDPEFKKKVRERERWSRQGRKLEEFLEDELL